MIYLAHTTKKQINLNKFEVQSHQVIIILEARRNSFLNQIKLKT